MIELIALPLLAGLALSVICGPLGCFVIWRRMAYFGDSIAHGALIGVALGVLLDVNITVAVVFVSLTHAIALTLASKSSLLSNDTLLGIMSHGGLAIGLILIGVLADSRVNLLSILMGDILTVSAKDALIIALWCVAAIVLIVMFWKDFLLSSIDQALAEVEGNRLFLTKFLLVSITAITIAISIKIVGALLISALLIIPASASRLISSSPEAMAILASITAAISTVGGFAVSYLYDVPTGPAMICTALGLYILIGLACVMAKRSNKIS